jgi:hypothetical protein
LVFSQVHSINALISFLILQPWALRFGSLCLTSGQFDPTVTP